MRTPLILLTLTALAIVAAWEWLGRPIAMPPSPLDPAEKLYCVSYAPFHDTQSPLDLVTRIAPKQIDEDLAQLAELTNCVRTYSVDFGLDRVPEAARRHGLKVLLGLWLSSHNDRNRWQIETAVALARQHPEVVSAVIVGNEALLRGEIAEAELARVIHAVKAQVPQPVTYADVWEFWLRHRALARAVDFVTIHILPYWEDIPIPARQAADHVATVYRHVAAAFPDKEILIGEAGWPSAGRMRQGALPSPANQALVIQDVLTRSKRENFRVNIFEAFDQPWKRHQEGTVGGHWGLFDDNSRSFKFAWGAPVSNHPYWRWQAAGGIAFAALVFATAWWARRAAMLTPDLTFVQWYFITINAALSGLLIGWVVENVLAESLALGGWLRSLALLGVSLAAPIVGAAALALNVAHPSFAGVLAAEERARHPLALALGVVLVALSVLAVQSALSLAFDPRYRDFPFAPLTAGVIPYLLLSLRLPQPAGRRGVAELACTAVLLLAAGYVAINETFANWQALWFCAALLVLAIILVQARAARG